MTRINVVPVSELCDQHLLAEHRELTRIPNGILKGTFKVHYDDRPSEYTLGAGHVKFFTNKLPWLFRRYVELGTECRKRGFYVKSNWRVGVLPQEKGQNYTPSPKDLALNRARIQERWPKKAQYYGSPYPA
jgi:hypothetical protein